MIFKDEGLVPVPKVEVELAVGRGVFDVLALAFTAVAGEDVMSEAVVQGGPAGQIFQKEPKLQAHSVVVAPNSS